MKKESAKIFGVRFDCLTMNDAYNQFVTFMTSEETKTIYTPNTEFVMKAQEDADFMSILNAGDLVIPDGIGVVIASKIHHLGLNERVPGVEMMTRILEYCNKTGQSIYLFGGKPGVPEKAAEKIKETYPNLIVKGMANGYFDEKEMFKIIDDINEKKPDVVFVALGAPKQEKWIHHNKKILNVKVAMGVGGSIDIWAGTAKRAPKWVQKIGFEWFYRLCLQPSRFLRMMVLPRFLIKVLLTRDISSRS